ncbi:chromatin structure-remodeling complex protein SYD [Iris pallida]|uniref:Chromatin structure-remodeling complex protein SYD n=1 Tax=Iris pallida TaxID=29817 RepID=A0AAX6EA35_IRIPA|nr:chromatin structure-remodeling complex protein SYD [Iris pallida]KAJ6800845.1 chromatin structure-remodeling complex protein SYD [Iris pallida]
MASTQHVELEAAKFLQKLIQDSKDEPVKLATKLYVICQHMRLSGKEQTLPYQVISRAMETVINQHGIDINVLKSSRLPSTGVPQMGDKEVSDNQLPIVGGDAPYRTVPSGSWQAASSSQMKEEAYPGSFQTYGMPRDSKTVMSATDIARQDTRVPNRQPVGLSRMDSGHDVHQGSASQKSNKSSDHESPGSVPMEDTRSANSQDRHHSVKSDTQTNKKDTKKSNAKRKRADSKVAIDVQSLQSDAQSTGNNSRKGKQMNKGGVQGQFVVKGGDHANPAQHTGHSEHMPSLSSGASQSFKAKQEGNPHLFSFTPTSKLPEEGEVSSGHRNLGLQNRTNILGPPYVGNQNKFSVPSGVSQGSVSGLVEPPPVMHGGATYQDNESEGNRHGAANDTSHSITLPANTTLSTGRVNVGASGAFNSFQMAKMGLPVPSYYNSSLLDNRDLAKKENNFGTSSSHLFEKGKDAIAVNTGMGFSFHASAKASLDSEHLKSGAVRDVASQFSEKVSDAQGSGSHERQSMGGIPGEAEAIHQRTHAFFARPKSEAVLSSEQNNMTEKSTMRSMPFKEQHLKQLRAQCLVFLAFRHDKNNLMPRKLHLEIALGASCTQDDGTSRGLNDNRGTDTSSKEPVNSHESSGILGRPADTNRSPSVLSTGSLMEADSSLKETENAKKKSKVSHDLVPEETGHITPFNHNIDPKMRSHENAESHLVSRMHHESDSAVPAVSDNHCEREGSDASNRHDAQTSQLLSVLAANKFPKVEGTISTGTRSNDDYMKESPVTTMVHQDSASQRVEVETRLGQSQIISGNHVAVNEQSPKIVRKEEDSVKHMVHPSKNVNTFFSHVGAREKLSAALDLANSNNNVGIISANDPRASNFQKHDIQKHGSSEGFRMMTASVSLNQGNQGTGMEKYFEQEEGNKTLSSDMPSSPPKYTTSEKWIMDHQKRKLAEEQKWAMKQRKAEERITASFNKLKA